MDSDTQPCGRTVPGVNEMDAIDLITAVATVLVVLAALTHPIDPGGR